MHIDRVGIEAATKKALTMTHSALSFWREDAQPHVLFLRELRCGLNVMFYRDGGWAERKRCVQIAEKVGVLQAAPADEFERGFHSAAEQIAAAIRADAEIAGDLR